MTEHTLYARIRRANDGDRHAVETVLTEAFLDDPLVRWLFPAPSERLRLQPLFYADLLDRPDAEAYLTDHDEAAALWLNIAPGNGQLSNQDPAGPNDSRLQALGQALAERHPRHEPHLYLACMGVLAHRQGAGLGSAMLRQRLERTEADQLAVYLEASSPRSRALYARHGFEDLGDPIRVADSPLLWPMWRPSANPASKGRTQ
ncbi:GNAT family N-acetyltransferase [Kribbella sp. NPDC055071]